METTEEPQMNGPDPPEPDHGLLAELESLRLEHQNLQSQSAEMEDTLALARRQRDDCVSEITNLSNIIEDLCSERDQLSSRVGELEKSLSEKEDDCARKFEEEMREREGLRVEIEVYRGKFESLERETEERSGFLSRSLDLIRGAKEGLIRVLEVVDDDKIAERSLGDANIGNGELGIDEELAPMWEEIKEVRKLVDLAEVKMSDYKELRKKEKKQLESSVVSLTEENRDISSLLRVALIEKEALEKSLNKLKGNTEQKRVPLLHFAERGLQRVGFGFMMGSGGTMEQPMVEGSGASSTGSKSDGSECEEDVVSLASTVEKIMKNLRLEISQLRSSLDEARSDNERLQSLTTKQAQEITENALYIRELEERERLLAQNKEYYCAANSKYILKYDLTVSPHGDRRMIKAINIFITKHVFFECAFSLFRCVIHTKNRDIVAKVTILQQELEKTRTALEISNGKLKLKEDLAAAAMAAQAAAEKSLQLADSRAAGLRERIEELTRQLEEADSRERSGRSRIRHICWPWRPFKVNPANHAATRFPNVRRMLPEMQSLLPYNV
ncbi:hypothetical protein CRG98_028874 [Punica granatum]|uniref:Uncharacterized protein n=1 Tax=Punica granatum TaxID=22663 RepID=A0A2I0J3E5_PUNGR|nr:hypothetical protein CRG98_028874 [Punica granatum]